MKFKRLFLTEDFSPSMPKWLQNYLMWNVSSHTGRISKYANPEFQQFRHANSRNTGRDYNGTAINVLRGIRGPYGQLDFSRAKFITAPVPQKKDDPIFSDNTKMCFVHLKSDVGGDETVWIPGYSSDTERFIFNDGRELTMKQLNSKLLRDVGKDFCYIDLSDSDNFTTDLKQSRKDSKQGMVNRKSKKEMDNYGYRDSSIATNRNWVDKSGYVVIPSVKKYEKQLKELKAKGLAPKLDETRDKLVQLQKDLQEISSQIMDSTMLAGNTSQSDYLLSGYRNAADYFTYAVNVFKTGLSYLDELNKMPTDSYWRESKIDDVMNSIQQTEYNIARGYNAINNFLPVVLDWDENDSSIFTDVEDDFE